MASLRTFEEITAGRLHDYQVFLFGCPANAPFSFALHPWFVVNNRGRLSRWEVLWTQGRCSTYWGHLHRDFLSPAQGIEVLPFPSRYYWKGRVLAFGEGDSGSSVSRLALCIECSYESYPHTQRYKLAGPNSNTYIQWVLNQFPDLAWRLPINSIGKSYRHSERSSPQREMPVAQHSRRR